MTTTNPDAVTEAELRAEARAWLGEHWRPATPRRAFLEAVVDDRWAAPSWPEAWFGRGVSPELARAVEEEFRAVDAPGSGQDVVNLWANTVLAFGSDDLRARFLRPLLLGDVPMCLLYSEPGAGSDLAGIQTRAERDGDEWVVNGQKVWTSGGRQAEYALLITRTDWDVPKHRGITFFFFPMRQPGVEVRPLRQATGDARFNEVFITDSRVPHANMLGELNRGWWVLQTALMYERAVMGGSARRRQEEPAAADRDPTSEASAPVPDLVLVDLARELGRTDDPRVRQHLARLHCMRTVNAWNGARARAAMEQGSSTPLASLGKLAMSGILHYAARVQAQILGAEALLGGATSPRAADCTYSMLNAYFTSIGGGTDQIQRNIIGERILGLPKEPELDKDLPFREVRKSPAVARD
jgi:alkylation response protein AidB-like acyl-CoA dehydrogenase